MCSSDLVHAVDDDHGSADDIDHGADLNDGTHGDHHTVGDIDHRGVTLRLDGVTGR